MSEPLRCRSWAVREPPLRRAVEAVGGARGALLASLPTVAYVIGDAVGGLVVGAAAGAVAGVVVLVERLRAGGPVERIDGAMALTEARRLGWAVVKILRFLPGDTRCLRRSLVLTQLLERRGISARLVIGARGGPDALLVWVSSTVPRKATCWVSVSGT